MPVDAQGEVLFPDTRLGAVLYSPGLLPDQQQFLVLGRRCPLWVLKKNILIKIYRFSSCSPFLDDWWCLLQVAIVYIFMGCSKGGCGRLGVCVWVGGWGEGVVIDGTKASSDGMSKKSLRIP